MIKSLFRHTALVLICLAACFPFLWMLVSSLKTGKELMDHTVLLPAVPQWQNYSEIFLNSDILLYIKNSFFVAGAMIVVQLLTGTLLAYALTFMIFKGRETLFRIIMGTYMLPTAATYIPCYMILAKLGLLDSHAGLILSNAVSIFGVFLLRQAFRQIPFEMMEAARIDGASHLKILWNIVIPMTKSTFMTFLVLTFIQNYNSYMWPSLITETPEKFMVSQGIRRFLITDGAYGTNWGLVMAASMVVVIPLIVIFLLAQRWIMEGIADTGSKG